MYTAVTIKSTYFYKWLYASLLVVCTCTCNNSLCLWAHAWICACLVQLLNPAHCLPCMLYACLQYVHNTQVRASVCALAYVSLLLRLSTHLLLFPYKHSSIVSCAWFIASMVQLYVALEFNGENGYRLVNTLTMISLQLSWLLMYVASNELSSDFYCHWLITESLSTRWSHKTKLI